MDRYDRFVPIRLERARIGEAAAIAALRTAANAALTDRFGAGFWSGIVTERWVRFRMRNESVFVVRRRGRILATLILAAKKPWSIDRTCFSPVTRPLYLIEMAVDPACQREGIGRACLAEAARIAATRRADAILLDAFDAKAGAGGFYRACGFREVGRATYRRVPLIYFERRVER